MNSSLVEETQQFVKQAFTEHPHYSFGHWSIMYNHSVITKDIALEIAKTVPCDKTLLAIGALLHDIGKTKEADPDILHTEHEHFNVEMSEDFLKSLDISNAELQQIEQLILFQTKSIEAKIIRDADALALYKDKILYMAFIKWATEEKLDWAIQRKIDKFDNLNFKVSKVMGEKDLERMKKDWKEFQVD